MLSFIATIKRFFDSSQTNSLLQWQERSFLFVLISISLAALPALINSTFRAIEEELWTNLISYFCAYLLCIVLIFVRSVPFRIRAWTGVLIFFGLGSLSIFSIGPLGSGRIWLFTTSIFTTLTLGISSGLFILAAQGGVLCLYGYLSNSGQNEVRGLQNYSVEIWTTTSITFAFLSIVSVVAMGSLIRGLTGALDRSKASSEKLAKTTKKLNRRIKAHRQSLASLKESEERWHFALEGAGDGVWDWDLQREHIHFSPSWTNMLGYGEKEFEGTLTNWSDCIHPDDRTRVVEAREQYLRNNGSYFQCKYRVKCKNNSYKWVLDRGKVMTLDDGGTPLRIIGTYTDITQLKNAEQERINLQKQLAQTQKMESMGTLAGGVAHDFNNILAAIIGYSELAESDIEKDHPAKEYIDEILQASNRATKLVKQILTFSRKTNEEMQPLQPQIIIKEAMNMMRSSMPSTIEIKLDLAAKEDLIFINPTGLHQIVVNLCTNALQAMKNQKGTLKVSLRQQDVINSQTVSNEHGPPDIQAIPRGIFTVLTVEDDGPGMDDKTKKKIFDPYFTTKPQGEGTGLGLATVQGIVNTSKGFIQVESILNKGTSFQIYFPTVQQEPKELVQTLAREDPVPLTTGKEHILFVDDEISLCRIAKTILLSQGYQVTTISNSANALKLFKTDPGKFDLIISDQTMPELTGTELAQNIFKERPDIPFIICTGYSSTISQEDVMAMGIKRFLNKPLSRRVLAENVRSVLDESIPS